VPKNYGVILLAAGLSSRFAHGDKLLHPWRGQPLLCWACAALTEVPLVARTAVIGPSDSLKRELLEAAGFRCVINPTPAAGMGSSLALGAQAIEDDVDGVFVVLGDMPALTSDIYQALIAAHREPSPEIIIAPTYAGQRGHPVLFGAAHLPALRKLRGDEGAREIIQAATSLQLLAVANAGVLRDLDTVEAFRGAE
jgi:molybdenum cofactor cytidylyltransferase